MDTKILEDLGLTFNEVKVYLALLDLGSTAAGPLIRKLHMHRAAVYDLLDMLIEKGIVSYVIQANRKCFEAQDPDRLLEYLESKKSELDEKKLELEKILPELHLRKKLSKEQEANIYKGKKGLKSIFEDILKDKREWLIFGASGKFKELFPAYYIHFHNRRVDSKIHMKILFNNSIRKERREKDLKLSEIRYLSDKYLTPSTTYIYNDKVVIISWGEEPIAFMIKSEEIAGSYRQFFAILWKDAKR
ncbi:TPA: hypothetical protein HA235_05610 [Candidatus Woesearchaeota archaeon]|nr:hypothetical protein [Candidatus Woesearchaeota archaeon]HIH32158.1 hypothetical protein [Candidatus Woesearchaeota archaeon]HIH55051.1 hypothetical protein [Candidatus Woesearchaeota archaeon]HIJ02473.1 hypothetical protein [Candidatus Woesearchaeota archaeon]HIJ14647.1 hypothetical protein [Candidatus Woesearchaeota archaeon]